MDSLVAAHLTLLREKRKELPAGPYIVNTVVRERIVEYKIKSIDQTEDRPMLCSSASARKTDALCYLLNNIDWFFRLADSIIEFENYRESQTKRIQDLEKQLGEANEKIKSYEELSNIIDDGSGLIITPCGSISRKEASDEGGEPYQSSANEDSECFKNRSSKGNLSSKASPDYGEVV